VLTAIPVFNVTGHQIALAAVLFGVIITWIFANDEKAEMTALFAVSMIMFKTNMRLIIAISVAYVFAVFIMLYVFSRQELLKAEKIKNRSIRILTIPQSSI